MEAKIINSKLSKDVARHHIRQRRYRHQHRRCYEPNGTSIRHGERPTFSTPAKDHDQGPKSWKVERSQTFTRRKWWTRSNFYIPSCSFTVFLTSSSVLLVWKKIIFFFFLIILHYFPPPPFIHSLPFLRILAQINLLLIRFALSLHKNSMVLSITWTNKSVQKPVVFLHLIFTIN